MTVEELRGICEKLTVNYTSYVYEPTYGVTIRRTK